MRPRDSAGYVRAMSCSEAFDFILLRRPLLEKDRDVTALLTQVMAGGPSMARVLNLIDTEVPSRKIPSRFTRKMMPFGGLVD